tara:strand:+ start:1771 stop:2277 length:507 start_codon:yes stop_codon:yes gene_type:complete
MKQQLLMDFAVNKENNSIAVRREFNAPLTLVWDAFTKSEILDQWWAPKPWKTRTKTMDFREGGHWHYAMVGPNEEIHWAWLDYKTIQFRKRFTGFDAFADGDGNLNRDMPMSTMEVIFADKGPITLVEFNISYDDLAQLETTVAMGFKDGLTTAMEGLDALLALSTNA